MSMERACCWSAPTAGTLRRVHSVRCRRAAPRKMTPTPWVARKTLALQPTPPQRRQEQPGTWTAVVSAHCASCRRRVRAFLPTYCSVLCSVLYIVLVYSPGTPPFPEICAAVPYFQGQHCLSRVCGKDTAGRKCLRLSQAENKGASLAPLRCKAGLIYR